MITKKTLRGVRTPKSYILTGVRSSDGKRLDQDLNRNLGAEIAKLSREKSELQQGLGGGNTMATYKLKRFSIGKNKTYKLKRKTFGVGDVINNTVNTASDVSKKVGGTALDVAGQGVATSGNIMQKTPGIIKRLGGALIGGAVGGPIGGLVGFGLGKKAVGAVGEGVTNIGDSISDAGKDLKGV